MRDLRSFLLLCIATAAGCGDNTTNTSDAAVDVAADVSSDAAADVSPDVARDVVSDATTDTAADVANDAPTDVASDAAPDAPRDASAEAASDIGTDAMADASASCGGNACAASEICLRQRTLGGAFLPPDDAGTCPAGRHVEGASCVADYAYRCVTRPTCAGATCDCLGTLCPTSFMCRGAEATLLTCEQLAP